MKPLIVLIAVSCLSVLAFKLATNKYNLPLSARIGLSAMLLFTAVGHFIFTKGMVMMIPDFIPNKTAVVYLTGMIEIAAAAGLLIPETRVITAWLLILFFVLIIPSNIIASIKHVDIEKGTFDGNGLKYLWFRIPLQILFIVWTYLCSIRF